MQDALSLAASIASGRTTAPAAMAAALEAAQSRAGLGATLAIDSGRAMAAARQPRHGVFAGVPFLGKDLGSGSAAFPPAAGVARLRRRQAAGGRDSDLFVSFREAGLVQFGLTAVPPFGLALTSDPARNPFNPRLSPGGSSGGAAAAVAAGIVAIAHATDAAGSIRVPAACCGLYGLKPSRGAVPGGPDFGNHLMGLAGELVLARSLRDVRAAFDCVAFRGPAASFAPAARIALTIPGRCRTAQAGAAAAAARTLQGLGFVVETRPAPDELGARALQLAGTILAASLAEWLDHLALPDDEIPPLAAAVAAHGRAMSAATLFAASRDMAIVTAELWNAFAGFDAILSPVLADGPPAFGAFDFASTSMARALELMQEIAPNVALANVAGAAALAMPFGSDENGMPAGIQLMSRAGADLALLGLGARLAEAAPAVAFPFPVAGHP